MARSALVVLIPEAEATVHDARLRHDPMAARGVPSHVTILHPFRAVLDTDTSERVGDLCRGTTRFTATFDSVGRFSGGVVYLAPTPWAAFAALTQAFARQFPDCPPYGGAYPDPVPHLTVASGVDGSLADSLEAELLPHLPISTVVQGITLLREDDQGMWTVDRSWPLSKTPSPQRHACE